MWIYIKTHAHQENSYYQHLIEHMVIWGYSDLEHYFTVAYGVSANSWFNYTSFYLPPVLDQNKFLDQIFSPLDFSVFAQEKEMIKQEMSEGYSDTTLLVNRLGKELYGKWFRWAAGNGKVSKKLIAGQHQKFYNKEHLWIADDDFHILSRPLAIKDKADFIQSVHSLSWVRNVRGEYYFYLLFNGSVETYAFVYFLDWILGVWGEYSSNYLWISYESKTWREFFEFPNHLLLCVDKQTRDIMKNFIIDSDFFNKAKLIFLETDVILSEIALISEISYGKIVDIQDLKNFIFSLNLQQIQQVLLF